MTFFYNNLLAATYNERTEEGGVYIFMSNVLGQLSLKVTIQDFFSASHKILDDFEQFYREKEGQFRYETTKILFSFRGGYS